MPKFIGWVPTQPEYVDAFFDLAPVSSNDVVYDLGSGDGRLLLAAAEKGAGKCVGVDIDPDRVTAGRQAAKNKGVDSKVTFIESDVLDVDLSEASVVVCYLYPSASAALRPKFEKELKPGTRVVMESFEVPGWKPAKTRELDYKNFYYYTMPPEKTPDYDTILNDPRYEHHEDSANFNYS